MSEFHDGEDLRAESHDGDDEAVERERTRPGASLSTSMSSTGHRTRSVS
ncbi:hypothetical protein [Actinoplanes sp. NPDC049802]